MEPIRPFSDLEWQLTPESVREYIRQLERSMIDVQKRLSVVEKRTEKLEVRVGKNSKNSSKPPSSDSPFSRSGGRKKKSKRAKGGQKGHKGHLQEVLPPGRTVQRVPELCSCGNADFSGQPMKPFYTHQHVELPEIKMDVTHFVLNRCRCPRCGKTAKAKLPSEAATGYGPRLSALVAELSGIKAMSRNDVKKLCHSVLGLRLATGTIQKIVDRASEAIAPAWWRIGRIARSAECNYIDETSWFKDNRLQWLWAMVSDRVAFYRLDPNRSKQAFERLIEDWRGVLVSDGYGCYRSWVDGRQTCLAHLIRKADGLAERKKPNLKRFGMITAASLRRLTYFAKAPPGEAEWSGFYARLLFTLKLFEEDPDDAGRLARQIIRELDCLWTFLDHNAVEPTNNRAERALRFAVLWRKRSLGTQSDKGSRWVERILSLKETCRLRATATFPVIVRLLRSYFHGEDPDLAWI